MIEDNKIHVDSYYITTPIFFVNAKPHIGHLYSCLIADFFTRYQKQCGNNCIFITGSDEHGKKMAEAAEKNSLEPRIYVDQIVTEFKKSWKQFDINYTTFIRTTSEIHKVVVDNTLIKLNNQKLFEYKDYSSFYCLHCEEYFTEMKAALIKYKCRNCQRDITRYSEKNYFFKVTSFQNWLKRLLKNNTMFIEPNYYVSELFNNFLNDDFRNLLIARNKINWGIPLCFDTNYEVYVWVEALCSYISALWLIDASGDLFENVWKKSSKYRIIHLMSKEVIRFHCIYWLILLKILNYNYKNVNVKIHGWLLVDGEKMSKSRHKTDSLSTLANKYSSDTVRFYLLYGHDVFNDFSFSTEKIRTINNSILVNKIGNVFQRVFCLYQQKKMKPDQNLSDVRENKDLALKIRDIKLAFASSINTWKLHQAVNIIVSLTNDINKMIDDQTPWLLHKKNDLKKFFGETFLLLRCLTWIMKPLLIKTVQKINGYFIFTHACDSSKGEIVKITVEKKWVPLFKKI